MNIEVRIYKRFDTDLLALHDAGYSISKMMAEALCSYANGLPCHFFVDEIIPFDLNDKKTVQVRLKIKDSDFNTVNLMHHIKHGYRSNVCKQILRNALVQQNIVCYLSDDSFFYLHERNAATLKFSAFQNLKSCSQYRRMSSNIKILGKEIEVKHERGCFNIPHKNKFPDSNIQLSSPYPFQKNIGYYGMENQNGNMKKNNFETPVPVEMTETPVYEPRPENYFTNENVPKSRNHSIAAGEKKTEYDRISKNNHNSVSQPNIQNQSSGKPVISEDVTRESVPTAAKNRDLMDLFDKL